MRFIRFAVVSTRQRMHPKDLRHNLTWIPFLAVRWSTLLPILVLVPGSRAHANLFTPPDIVVAQEGEPDHDKIQDAINAASPGDRIEVREGTYVENIDLMGKAVTLYALDGPGETIIQGDGTGPVVTCDSGETAQTGIVGFFITGGGNFGTLGGGIRIVNASPSIIGCKIETNKAVLGAGIYIDSGEPLILNCTFWDDDALNLGGGIYAINSDFVAINCTFGLNFTSDGGAVYLDTSDPTITNCILWDDSPNEIGISVFTG